jgi:uncharacterized protein YdaL
MRRPRVILLLWCALWAAGIVSAAAAEKKVLIVVEGPTSLKNYAIADGRELAALLGHFHATAKVIGVRDYVRGEAARHDILFYIGFNPVNRVPAHFLDDLLAVTIPVVWLNTGFLEFSSRPDVQARFGFAVTRLDSTNGFVRVRMGSREFAKGEQNINVVEIRNRRLASIVATAFSPRTRREIPYIVRSGNLLYFADCPMASAGESDRYLLFADMLHDILGEDHEESHSALIRIEDVNPLDNPNQLREVADILSARGIPFLVGVSPFYVDPSQGIRIPLSDKPEVVDALKYMVRNGGTIVMHGVTHQYKGITGSDFEFWDSGVNGPIRDETVDGIRRKLEMGIQEFMRNGLYPLIWETPHYTASFRLYQTIGEYFSTAMEQRLAIEDFDCSQFFPYIINRDLFGQVNLPENLGYIPLDPDIEKGRASIRALLANARTNLCVRDGFASNFFHAFLDLRLLEELVDSVQALGYTYLDVRDLPLRVQTKDRLILTGKQSATITLADQYLVETWFARDGEVQRTATSEKRLSGATTRMVDLAPGEWYKAEPAEFREREAGVVERTLEGAGDLVRQIFGAEEPWQEMRPVVLWNHYAWGAAFNDQASFAAALGSINLRVDTLFFGEQLDLRPYNLVIVPYAFTDSLSEEGYDLLTRYVAEGGNLITDAKNDLVENFGIRHGTTRIRVQRVRDRLFPDERIRWTNFELTTKFDAEDVARVFAIDEVTESPLVIGKPWRKGKVLYFSTRFDPLSQDGTSYYPFLLEYIRSYFQLGPVLRRDQLEVYFDPGFRRNLSTEALVKQWVRQGIRILHVAGWHEYPKYTYDYDRLLRLAHANGILVYAWLEPPQVSQKFWLEHPEWREKNRKGEDVRPSWRYPVAMTDPRCLDSLVASYQRLLQRFNWDGVNLAELYFEAGRGFLDPDLFTPMHPSAQREFWRRYGYDLKEVLDTTSARYWKINSAAAEQVTEYRVQTLEEIYHRLLPMLAEAGKEKPGFQIIVTAMDSYHAPELRGYIGVDMGSILALQKRYGFVLQAEDPEHFWSTDPHRYQAIGKEYERRLGDRSKLMLDLNILSFRRPEQVTPFPTLIQTGTESFHLVRSASLGAPRLTIYAESSINPQDVRFLPYALASEALYRPTEKGYTISSPYAVTLTLPPQTTEIRVDGVPLAPSRENLFLIPAGDHEVRLGADATGAFSTHQLDTKLLSCTGNLLAVSYGLRSIVAEYASETRTLVAINREPTAVKVDGVDLGTIGAMKGNDCYAFYLPPGHHRVEITAGDAFSYGVNLTSLWSTTAIALFGALAVLSLLAMYVGVRVARRRVATAGEGS